MAASQSMSNVLVGDYNIKSLIDSERYPNRRTEEPKKQHACLKNEYINADFIYISYVGNELFNNKKSRLLSTYNWVISWKFVQIPSQN